MPQPLDQVLTGGDIALRLGLAVLAGIVVGFERESHGRAAGLRTTLLVSVAAALAMVISQHLFYESIGNGNGGWRPDPARLAAGILTGMGFLGAGAIIRQDNVVRGVTTAAVLWYVTILGLAFGSGNLFLGGVGLGIALLVLFVMPQIEGWIKNDWYANVSVTLAIDGISDEEIRKRIEGCGVKIKRTVLDYQIDKKQKTLQCELKFKKIKVFDLSEKVVQRLRECPGVVQVQWS